MTTEQLAWLAGLYEGEGCREFWHKGNGSYAVSLRIAMTDRDTVESIRAVTGVGSVDALRVVPGKRPIYRWTVTRREQVAALIRGMLPFLHARRREQLAPLLAHCEERLEKRKPTRKGYVELTLPALPALRA